MSTGRTLLLTAALAVIAAGLRFWHLGDWPFANDETATFQEADALFSPSPGEADSQIGRLPRMVPLAHATHYLGYSLFGRDEFGSRALPALLGVAQVCLLFLGLRPLLGLPAALAAGLMAALWPEHLFQSQQNRFYMPACFTATAALLAGGYAVRRHSPALTALTCVLGFVAVLALTLNGLLFPGLVVGVGAAAVAARRPLPWRMLAVACLGAACAAVFYVGYVKPLQGQWNAGEAWGYSPLRGLLGAVQLVGLPWLLLAPAGGLLLLRRDPEQGGYWLTWAAVWAVGVVVLPKFVVYHPSYAFPLAVSVVVLSGYAVGAVFERLRAESPLAATAWFAGALALCLPALASYYQDGGRPDYRTPARFIAAHWHEGDRVVAVSPGLLSPYAPFPLHAAPLTPGDPLPDLKKLSPREGRTWVVLPRGRSGHPEELRRWLDHHCVRELEVRRGRFDYPEFAVDVYLYPAEAGRKE